MRTTHATTTSMRVKPLSSWTALCSRPSRRAKARRHAAPMRLSSELCRSLFSDIRALPPFATAVVVQVAARRGGRDPWVPASCVCWWISTAGGSEGSRSRAGNRACGLETTLVADVHPALGAGLLARRARRELAVCRARRVEDDADQVAVRQLDAGRPHGGRVRAHHGDVVLVVGEVRLFLVRHRPEVGLRRGVDRLLPLVQEDRDGDGGEDAYDDDDDQELDEGEAALTLLLGLADSSEHLLPLNPSWT